MNFLRGDVLNYFTAVLVAFKYMKNYFGAIHFDPSKELKEIPPHSAFFILDHNNRSGAGRGEGVGGSREV